MRPSDTKGKLDDRTERSRAKQILEQAGAEDVADTAEARV
jgi:hypothetical protein